MSTFVVQIYEELKHAGYVETNEDFSIRFLQKSPKYYSAIKSQHNITGLLVLMDLAQGMCNNRVACCSYREIEERVVAEIAWRATKCNKLDSSTLVMLIDAMQELLDYHPDSQDDD